MVFVVEGGHFLVEGVEFVFELLVVVGDDFVLLFHLGVFLAYLDIELLLLF